ncbi:SRPBCC family protein [Streptomyces sp. NPDC058657]|uniref:SRPBCC family protein n=1 Tax=unclassified Streptomyces TaxID=2593676 RepID=UPI0036490DCF
MDWCHYRFRSIWELHADPAAVLDVLGRPEDYPHWWPQVRAVTPVDARNATVRIRSFLPYDLVVTAQERRRDPAAGVLETGLTGDMTGWARWTVRPARLGKDHGTRAFYEQVVDVRRPLLRNLAVPGRPVFLANHAWMMRSGRRALAAALAV